MTISAKNLELDDIARLFGTSPEHIPDACREMISANDFTYNVLDGKEHQVVIEEATAVLGTQLEVAGAHRQARWEEGWSENLSDFIDSGYDLKTLMPKFMHPGEVMRLEGQYIRPVDERFEMNLNAVLHHWIFNNWFSSLENIYEFGCGTGHNLVTLAELFPDKNLHGLDWAEASQGIIKLIAEKYGYEISGSKFNLLEPDNKYRVEPGSGVFTTGALEQIGDSFRPFLEYLLDQSPEICIHLETTRELYDLNNPFDLVAARYVEVRGYLNGYLTRLRELEKEGRVEIEQAHRVFGSRYHDGYTLVVWRPV
jgi:hypothetical protein